MVEFSSKILIVKKGRHKSNVISSVNRHSYLIGEENYILDLKKVGIDLMIYERIRRKYGCETEPIYPTEAFQSVGKDTFGSVDQTIFGDGK